MGTPPTQSMLSPCLQPSAAEHAVDGAESQAGFVPKGSLVGASGGGSVAGQGSGFKTCPPTPEKAETPRAKSDEVPLAGASRGAGLPLTVEETIDSGLRYGHKYSQSAAMAASATLILIIWP